MTAIAVRSGLRITAWAMLGMLGAGGAMATAFPFPPPGFVAGPVAIKSYDGIGDDLLTAGLGAAGLAGAAPAVSDPPTAAELRRLAIYNNYRALVDMTPGGGYGTLYGPAVGVGGEGKIAGKEYLAFARGRGGDQNITLLVQIPASFDPRRACIVSGPSSGSRGVYGAIATSGEWGLKKGCAVAYTDKGTGIGAHDLSRDRVGLIDGTRTDATTAGRRSTFTARLTEAEKAAFNAAYPNRFAWKHAHSQRHPERDWGQHVLQALEFALWALNVEHGRRHPGRPPRFNWANTLVIASSVSNGGGASLLAAEQARAGIIDGIAVSEPNVNPRFDGRFVIRQGDGPALARHSRPLYDYITLVNLYQGCANRDPALATAPLNLVPAALGDARCQSLKEAGLLTADTVEAQAEEAQARINAYGILAEQNIVQPSHWFANVPQGVAVTYANAYARASVLDRLCGYSFAATDPAFPFGPVPLAAAAEAVLFGTGNGIPPTGGVGLVNDDSLGGPANNLVSVSPRFGRADQNAQGALCLRGLLTGGPPPLAPRLRQGIAQILATGRLGGVPTIIVTGRADAILPPNHASRPYYALSLLADGRRARIRYYEVTNAQHLDAFNAFPGFNERFVPLHHYFIQALDLMWAYLTTGAALPPSQLVRTTPRGAGAPPIALANLPAIAASPPAADRITFDGRVLRIPQ